MKLSIHQPSYFPWFGLLDKIAKSDMFIILDNVQLADRAFQHRNVFLTNKGEKKTLTININKKGYRNKGIKDIEICEGSNWQKYHSDFIIENYKSTLYFNEVWNEISFIYSKDYQSLIEVLLDSMYITFKLLDIKTSIEIQSKINYDKNKAKSDLILDICKNVKCDTYLSGTGAKDYMNLNEFEENNICVEFQKFNHPVYFQKNSENFIEGLTILDCFFNNGIEPTKKMFWDNVVKDN